MAVDLNNLSTEELEQVIAEARARIEHKREEAVVKARAEIERIAASTGYSVKDLLGMGKPRPRAGTAKAAAVADKYRNPRNPEQSWSGRGKRPRWLQEQLAKGGKLESFLAK